MKRIYINREAITKNRDANGIDRRDIITVAHFYDTDQPEDPNDQRQGCDRGAYRYQSGIAVEIQGPSMVVHDPQMQHGASVWVETNATLVVVP